MGKKVQVEVLPPAEVEAQVELEEPPGEQLHGEFLLSDGSTYEGQYWKDDSCIQMHGKGILRCGHEVFDGMFENGQYKVGMYTNHDGVTYTGNFRSNVFHGPGEYTWPDGRIYRGMWINGRMHGRGEYEKFSFGTSQIFKGFSLEGKFESGRKEQVQAKQVFHTSYGCCCIQSASATLQDVVNRMTTEVPKDFLVSQSPSPSDEAESERAVVERALALAVVTGPFPEVTSVSPSVLHAFVAGLVDGAERPVRVTVLEEQEQTDRFDGRRLQHEQLQYVGQAIEFSLEAPDPLEKAVVATPFLVLVNISAEFDIEKSKWKLVHYEE